MVVEAEGSAVVEMAAAILAVEATSVADLAVIPAVAARVEIGRA
jgi:hypothetical protein